jgi:hypothetical protein
MKLSIFAGFTLCLLCLFFYYKPYFAISSIDSGNVNVNSENVNSKNSSSFELELERETKNNVAILKNIVLDNFYSFPGRTDWAESMANFYMAFNVEELSDLGTQSSSFGFAKFEKLLNYYTQVFLAFHEAYHILEDNTDNPLLGFHSALKDIYEETVFRYPIAPSNTEAYKIAPKEIRELVVQYKTTSEVYRFITDYSALLVFQCVEYESLHKHTLMQESARTLIKLNKLLRAEGFGPN